MQVTLMPNTDTRILLDLAREQLEAAEVPKAGCGFGRLRWEALEKAEHLGLPTRRQEQWRFTGLRQLLSTPWATPSRLDEQALANSCASLIQKARLFSEASQPIRLVFVNGQFSTSLSNWQPGETSPEGLTLGLLSQTESLLSEAQQALQTHLNQALEQTEQGLPAMMQALASDGLYIRVERDAVIERPIEITALIQEQAEATLAPIRLLVDALDNSQATLGVQSFNQTGETLSFAHLLTHIELKAGAKLDQSQAWQPSQKSLMFSEASIYLNGDNANYRLVQLATGGNLQRHAVQVAIEGEGADAQLYGLQALNGQTQLHQHVQMDHRLPQTTSAQMFKALVDGEAKAEFEGRIFVRKDAQQTNAEQLSKALLLSPKGKAFTRPWLNIDADDVKCSHGATVGQLSDDELFYLASRGLSDHVARCLLTYGFAADVLQQESRDDVRDALTDRTLEALWLTKNPAFCFTSCTK